MCEQSHGRSARRRRKKGIKNVFEETMTGNFPNPKKKMVNHSAVLKWNAFWTSSTSFESLSSLLLVNDRNLKTYTSQKIDDFDREGQ